MAQLGRFNFEQNAPTFLVPSPLVLSLPGSLNSKSCRPCSKARFIVCAISKTPDSSFSKWAASVDISMPSLVLTTFKPKKSQTSRGLTASAPISKRTTLINVPSKSALQVTSSVDEKVPPIFNIPRPDWRRLPWFVRLALLLISVKRDKSHPLHDWVNLLPSNVDVPYHWSDSDIQQLQSERFKSLILTQRRNYDQYFQQIRQLLPRDTTISKADFFSAVDCVRSRAFSGPLETAPFRERFRLSLFIAANTFAWPLLNVLPWENALNGGLTAMFSLAVFDIIFPRVQRIMGGTESKRYAMVPGVDMFNHNAIQASESKVEFRYFTDSFDVLSAADYAVDDEVYISYGAQSNDAFLQYYGFVEENNPAEDIVFDGLIAKEIGLPEGDLYARKDGFDAKVFRRVQKRIGGDKEKTITLLRKICQAQLELFDTTAEDDQSLLNSTRAASSTRLVTAIRYRRSKKLLLQNILNNWENKN